MDQKIGNFYFQRSTGERVLLAENVNQEAALPIINKFLDEHNFKSHYIRIWKNENNNEIWFDVGSWSEFFILVLLEGK